MLYRQSSIAFFIFLEKNASKHPLLSFLASMALLFLQQPLIIQPFIRKLLGLHDNPVVIETFILKQPTFGQTLSLECKSQCSYFCEQNITNGHQKIVFPIKGVPNWHLTMVKPSSVPCGVHAMHILMVSYPQYWIFGHAIFNQL